MEGQCRPAFVRAAPRKTAISWVYVRRSLRAGWRLRGPARRTLARGAKRRVDRLSFRDPVAQRAGPWIWAQMRAPGSTSSSASYRTVPETRAVEAISITCAWIWPLTRPRRTTVCARSVSTSTTASRSMTTRLASGSSICPEKLPSRRSCWGVSEWIVPVRDAPAGSRRTRDASTKWTDSLWSATACPHPLQLRFYLRTARDAQFAVQHTGGAARCRSELHGTV